MSNITLGTPDQLMALRSTYMDKSGPLEVFLAFFKWKLSPYANTIDKQILGKITGVYNSTLSNCRVRDMCIGNFGAIVDCGKGSNFFQIEVAKDSASLFRISRPSISTESKFFVSYGTVNPYQVVEFGDNTYRVISSQDNINDKIICKNIQEKEFLNDADRWIMQSLRSLQTEESTQNTKLSGQDASSKPSETPTQNATPTAQTPSSTPSNTSSNPSAGSDQTNGLGLGAGCFAVGLGLGIIGDRLYAKKKARELSNAGSIPSNRLSKA